MAKVPEKDDNIADTEMAQEVGHMSKKYFPSCLDKNDY